MWNKLLLSFIFVAVFLYILPSTGFAQYTLPAAGQISASPNPCTIPSGGSSCTSYISWNSQHARSTPTVIIRETGGLFSSAASGNNIAAPWIPASGYNFDLWDGSTLLSSVRVYGTGGIPATGQISASPNPCSIPGGSSTCTSTLNWSTQNAPNVQVTVRETGGLLSSNPSGAVSVTWIPTSGYNFDLWNGSTLLSSVRVYGTGGIPAPTGQISANPNPCAIPGGSSTCTSTISWSTQNTQGNVTVWVRETGGLVSSGPTSSAASAPWIPSTGYWFDLYDGVTLLNSVFVYGTYAPPGSYIQFNPTAACPGSYVTLAWTPSANATNYYVIYRTQANLANTPMIDVTNQITYSGGAYYYVFTGGQGVSPGSNIDFIILAGNSSGTYAYSDSGVWSSTKYGWTKFPDCNTPGYFTQSPPQPSCASVGNPQIVLNWSASSKATGYYVYYIDSSVGVFSGGFYTGLSQTYTATAADGFQSGHKYAFIIYAVNANGATFSDNTTYSAYTDFYTCNTPSVTLTIDSGDSVKSIDNGGSIQLNYAFNYVYNCTSSAAPAVAGSTTPWTNLYPSNTAVSNPMGGSGAISLTLYNDAAHGNNASYLFTLLCSNNKLNPVVSVSKTVTVNVQPGQSAYIQTTQGDIHSNKNITLP